MLWVSSCETFNNLSTHTSAHSYKVTHTAAARHIRLSLACELRGGDPRGRRWFQGGDGERGGEGGGGESGGGERGGGERGHGSGEDDRPAAAWRLTVAHGSGRWRQRLGWLGGGSGAASTMAAREW